MNSESLATPSLLKSSRCNSNFEEEWPKIRPVVLKLLNQEHVSKQDWQELFWVIHSICSWVDKGGKLILDHLQREINAYVKQAGSRIFVHATDEALLRAYIAEWGKFYTQSIYLPMPFAQVESNLLTSSSSPSANRRTAMTLRQPGKHQQEDSAVRKLMLNSWNTAIFKNIQSRLLSQAMHLLEAERNAEYFDSQLVIGVRESYVSLCQCSSAEDRLGAYKEYFEKAYIEATEHFYRAKAPLFLASNGVQAYMKYADDKLREEEERASKYLETGESSNSVHLLINKCVEVLVGGTFREQILAECPAMIRQKAVKKLQLMFRLMNRSPNGIKPMLSYMEEHIKNQGLQDMLANAESITADPEKYVEQLLSMFTQFSNLVSEAFYDDPRFLTSRDKAFQDVINDTTVFRLELSSSRQKSGSGRNIPESKCPELLANYCELLLRKSQVSRKLTSDETDAKLQDVLLVLKYVQNKDVFMRYHKGHLARRLILDSSADSEKEEIMVNKLREAGMPADYINRLYRMLLDLEVSQDLNKKFKSVASFSNNNRNTVADFVNIKILNAGAWARGADRVPVSLPRELEDFIPEVEEFYRSQHSGRKLQWCHHMSHGTIQFSNEQGRFDLDVTTFQFSVLFCWNERPLEAISYENLRLATVLPDVELRRTLWSLVAFPKLKHQVLISDCPSRNPKDFTDSTLFWTNQEFCIVKNGKPQKRGRCNLIGRLQLSVEQAREQDDDAILQLRILRVQEGIVKVMKIRKRLSNAQLQTELVELLKGMFLPSRKMIKEQIEWLIDNRYIARDEDNINTFVYLA